MNYLENLSCLNKKSNFGSKHAKLHYRPHLELEPYHQILDLTIDILKKYVNGSVTTKIVARKTGKNLKIELNGINLKIESIKSVTEDTKEFLNVSWSYNDDIINCKWKKDWIKGEKRDLIIFYSIKAPVGGLYFSSPTNNEPDKPVFVHADHETERARYWLPCIDHPSVRCTLDINLTSRKEYSILANGRLIRESETNNDTKTAHWKLDIPCPSYLITLCIGDLVTYKDRDADFGYGPIPIEYFTSKRYISDNLRITFSKTPEMIEWMRNKLGKLEYPKYFQYALPQVSGAMENISLVSWDDFVILDEIFAKEISWNIDQTNVHELAHSWFGDVVVMKDFSHAWLKESWATYMETVWLEEKVSKEEGDYDRYTNEIRYINETKNYFRPIVTNKYDSSWDLFDNHLYPGGSQRIDMLRKLIGDDIFWPAVKHYLESFKNKVVETIDFQRSLESHSGLNLQKFFDQWIYGKGYPNLKIGYKFDDEHQFIELEIKQNQVDKKNNIGIFDFDLDISVTISDDSTKMHTIHINEQNQTFYIKSKDNPKVIEIDPLNKILIKYEFNPGQEILKEIVKHGSTKNKIVAVFELAKKNHGNTEFIGSEYKMLDFWGMKIQFLKALSTIPQLDAINSIFELIKNETEAKVLYEAVKLLKDVKFSSFANEVKDLIQKHDPPYYLYNIGLLNAYSTYRKNDSLKFLASIIPKGAKADLIQQGLYEAIGNLRTEKATNYLIDQLFSNKTKDYFYPVVISSISNSLTWANSIFKEQIKLKLIPLVTTENNDLTLNSLAKCLANLEDMSVIPHLRKIELKIPFQDHPSIEKLIENITKGKIKDSKIETLENRLTKIEKENLKMKDNINKLELLQKKLTK